MRKVQGIQYGVTGRVMVLREGRGGAAADFDGLHGYRRFVEKKTTFM